MERDPAELARRDPALRREATKRLAFALFYALAALAIGSLLLFGGRDADPVVARADKSLGIELLLLLALFVLFHLGKYRGLRRLRRMAGAALPVTRMWMTTSSEKRKIWVALRPSATDPHPALRVRLLPSHSRIPTAASLRTTVPELVDVLGTTRPGKRILIRRSHGEMLWPAGRTTSAGSAGLEASPVPADLGSSAPARWIARGKRMGTDSKRIGRDLRDHPLRALGGLLIAVSWLSVLFLLHGMDLLLPGWGDLFWIAAGTHAAGWGLRCLDGDEGNLGPEDSRAGRRGALRGAGALVIVAAALMLLGLEQYGQWREYHNAPRCTAADRAAELASSPCISEQAAVVESIQVDPPGQASGPYNSRDPTERLKIRLADGHKLPVTVLRPPGVPYTERTFPDFAQHRGTGCFVSTIDGNSFDYCKVPVKARLYRGHAAQLIVPGGQTADTAEQPGRFRLVAWLSALCLLGALWPLLPAGLGLRRAGGLTCGLVSCVLWVACVLALSAVAPFPASSDSPKASSPGRPPGPVSYPLFGASLQDYGGLEGLHGLGASVRAFNRHNRIRPQGAFSQTDSGYTIDATSSAGRVTAYSVNYSGTPRPSNGYRIAVAREEASSPPDATWIRSSRHAVCQLFRSPILAQLVGKQYARAVSAIVGTYTVTVHLKALSRPTCT